LAGRDQFLHLEGKGSAEYECGLALKDVCAPKQALPMLIELNVTGVNPALLMKAKL